MKKIFSLLLILCAFTFISCSSDDTSPLEPIVTPNPLDTSLYFKFSVDGQDYSFEPETMTSLRKLVTGYKFANNCLTRVSLWMPIIPTVGIHQLVEGPATDANANTFYNANYMSEEDVYESTTGTLNILEIDSEYIKGTFSFTGTKDDGATKVVNGTFRAYN